LRFAFKASPQNATWAALLELWRAADDIEVFESGWTSDHFYPTHSADPSVPRQRPHPPICIGGSGEKRTLRITAKYADHWNFVGGPPEEFARKRDVLTSHCSDIGRDPKEIMLSAHVRLNPDRNYGQVVEDAAALGKEGLDLAIVYLPPPYDPAVLEPLANEITASGLLTSKVD
jgi:hypothetical protein